MKSKFKGKCKKISRFEILKFESIYLVNEFEYYYNIINKRVDCDMMDFIIDLRVKINDAKNEKELDELFMNVNNDILYNMYRERMRLLNKKNWGNTSWLL